MDHDSLFALGFRPWIVNPPMSFPKSSSWPFISSDGFERNCLLCVLSAGRALIRKVRQPLGLTRWGVGHAGLPNHHPVPSGFHSCCHVCVPVLLTTMWYFFRWADLLPTQNYLWSSFRCFSHIPERRVKPVHQPKQWSWPLILFKL